MRNNFQNARKKIMRTLAHADFDAEFFIGVLADADFCITVHNFLFCILQKAKVVCSHLKNVIKLIFRSRFLVSTAGTEQKKNNLKL